MIRRFILLFLPVVAAAQEAKPGDPIHPGRADFVESPRIVPVGSVQLEFGVNRWGRTSDKRPRTELDETTIRYGLFPRAELRIDLPSYSLSDDPGSRGWGDTRLYAIVSVGKVAGFDIGYSPAITFPSGTVGVGDGLVQPELYLLLRREVGNDLSFGGTFGSTYARRDGEDVSASRAAVNLRQSIGWRTDVFVEYAGFYNPQQRPRNFAHVGLIYRVSNDAAFDIHTALGLNRGSEQGLLSVGYSVRF